MAIQLDYHELVQLVDNVLNPMAHGFSSEEVNQQLLLFLYPLSGSGRGVRYRA